MKFSEIPYTRPDVETLNARLSACADRIAKAENVKEQIAAFDQATELNQRYQTDSAVAEIRNSINTADAFYEGEREFLDEAAPKLEETNQKVHIALLDSPFRKELEAHYGSLLFQNLEIARRSFTPEMIPLMQEASKLEAQYQKLYAGMTVEFNGETMPLPMLGKYKESADRATRREAYRVEGECFDAHQGELDEIFDRLVKNRNAQARLLGYENYLQLGYDRLGRNCYGTKELEAFRRQIAEDLVPLVAQVKEAQRKRIGVDRLCIYDDGFRFPEGNAKPQGTADDILAAGKTMYQQLSPETKDFIEELFRDEMFDVLSRDGKAPGGYCSNLPCYHMPFIFSNFNGTAGDVDVLTHEAGHAFAFYRAAHSDIHPHLQDPTLEACECHSMSMEFLTQDFHKYFFGEKTGRYELAHCEESLDFIPYGCMIDEFQHRMYENENLSPEERNQVWKELERKYRPWLDMDHLPFYGRYSHWQWKLHVYLYPLYYIDYCMAQLVAYQLWMLSLKDRKAAWEKYLAFVDLAGTKTFADLCRSVGLRVPYEEGVVKEVATEVSQWLRENSAE